MGDDPNILTPDEVREITNSANSALHHTEKLLDEHKRIDGFEAWTHDLARQILRLAAHDEALRVARDEAERRAEDAQESSMEDACDQCLERAEAADARVHVLEQQLDQAGVLIKDGDRLAVAVDLAVQSGLLNARSGAADALLDFKDGRASAGERAVGRAQVLEDTLTHIASKKCQGGFDEGYECKDVPPAPLCVTCQARAVLAGVGLSEGAGLPQPRASGWKGERNLDPNFRSVRREN